MNFINAVKLAVNVCDLHSANNSFPVWVEYEEICALMWREGSRHGKYHAFEVEFIHLDHPIANGFNKRYPMEK